jgi:glycosyltransferase involved in cell wall biosynthesis
LQVLLVSHRFPPDGVAGVERTTEGLSATLREYGDEVTVVARRHGAAPPRPKLSRERLSNGVHIYRFRGGGFDLERFAVHRDRLNELFEIALLERSPDVVHINHLLGMSPDYFDIAEAHGAAVVLSIHDFYFACPLVHLQKYSGELCQGPDGGRECATTCFAKDGPDAYLRWGLRALIFRRLLAKPRRIIYPSEFIADFFNKFGAPPEYGSVIANGVADALAGTPSRPRPQIEPRALTIAYCGTVVRHKGLHLLLDALRVAKIGPVQVRVLGAIADREYAAAVRALADDTAEIEIRFYGDYELSALPSLLGDADFAVLPSIVPEAGPTTPREIIACGVPIVVPALGAFLEIVEEGRNGLFFMPGRAASLGAVIQRLAEDETLLGALQAGAASATVRTITHHTRDVRRVYEEAIASGPRTTTGDDEGFLRHAVERAGFASSAPQ